MSDELDSIGISLVLDDEVAEGIRRMSREMALFSRAPDGVHGGTDEPGRAAAPRRLSAAGARAAEACGGARDNRGAPQDAGDAADGNIAGALACVTSTGADAGADRTPTGRDGAKTGSRRHCSDTEPAAAFASAADDHAPGAGCATGGAAGSAPAARPHADRATGSGYAAPRASRAAGFYPAASPRAASAAGSDPAASPRAGSAAGPDSATRDADPDRFSIAAARDRGPAASIAGAAIANLQ